MGTPLGPKYIPYSYMDPLGVQNSQVSVVLCWNGAACLSWPAFGFRAEGLGFGA